MDSSQPPSDTPLDPTYWQDPDNVRAAKLLIARQAWTFGVLDHLFHATQDKIYRALKGNRRRKFYILCSRRLGKTFLLLTVAFETALRKPNARVLFLAPTAKQATQIATDIAAQILAGGGDPDFSCPADLKPEYKGQSKEFHFKNGSIVRLSGVNNEHADDIRGIAADLVILDEAGQMDNLKHVVSSIVMPTTMTTNGLIVLATTPPDSPGHDSAGIYEELAQDDATIKFTIRDAPHVSEETKAEYLVEAGEDKARALDIVRGKLEAEGSTALREYFCEFVTDASKAVVPEFTPEKRKQICVEMRRPEYFDTYVSIDPGFDDRTGILFAYYDFLEGLLVVEDEALLHRANTNQIAKVIREKELQLWPGRTPFMRISDTDKRLIADLSQLHGLSFTAARKEDSLGAVNLMRTDVQSNRIIINPRCQGLIRQLSNAIWNNQATDFARAGESSPDGHYDLLAALKYLVRAYSRERNPYPAHYMARGGKLGPSASTWFSPKATKKRESQQLGLFQDTPLGRRLAGLDKKKR